MRKSASIELIVCDACDTQEILGDSGDINTPEVPIGWFSGNAVIGGHSDDVIEWAACKPAHIKNAILNAMDLT